MKNHNSNRIRIYKFLSIMFLVYAIILSTSYAILSDTLSFSGVARTVTYYSGTDLPVTPLIMPGSTEYYTYSYIRSCEQRTDNETHWSGSTAYTTHTKYLCTYNNRTVTYTISFRNDTVLTMTNGTASASIVQNDSSRVSSVSAGMNKTTIAPGESVELTLTIAANFVNANGTQIVLGTYAFEFQNSIKYVYYQFTYEYA